MEVRLFDFDIDRQPSYDKHAYKKPVKKNKAGFNSSSKGRVESAKPQKKSDIKVQQSLNLKSAEGAFRPDLDDGLKVNKLEANPCPEGRVENFMEDPYLQRKRAADAGVIFLSLRISTLSGKRPGIR